MSRRLRFGAAIGIMLFLSGCSVGSAEEPEIPGYSGNPTLTATPLDVVGESPIGVVASASGRVLSITTVGSGSCPWVPKIAAIDDVAKIVTIHLTRWASDACTADEGPTTFELETDRDLAAFAVEVTVEPDESR